jgi:pimeloyl-ACP methyl ester carboxylesterase
MLPDFILKEAENLTELTSINLLKKITSYPIQTPLNIEPILTTYVQQNSGNFPILFLHGFDSSLLEFRRLLPLISSANYTTWAVDLLGLGFTERKPDLLYNTDAIKTHLYSFWQTLIQQPIILVGASMGGATAIDFTLSYPDIVTKLILIDSGGLTPKPLMSKFIFPPLDNLATNFLSNPKVRQNISRTAYYNKNFANEDALICAGLHLKCPYWNKALISFTKSGGYGSYANYLHEIKQPTLIIWGENDQILGTKPATKFKNAIANSELIWLKECGHVPHLEKPEITANFIL